MDERLPEPGWYPDPAGGSALRYWDGQRWASSSGDRRSAETARDAPGDATQPIDLRDPPPAPNQADAWESYPNSGAYTRGPFRPLAVVVLLVVVAGAVLAFALGGDGDDRADGDNADTPAESEAADGSDEAAAESDGQGATDEPTGGRVRDDEDGTDADDGEDPDDAGDEPDDAGEDGEPDADDGPIVLDGRCEVPREQVGDAEVSELRAWDFDACDLAPLDPGDGEQLIVITASLDGSSLSEAAAQETAGERELLWSSHYPALSPGFWVVYLGPFDGEEAAEEAADEAGGGAYLRRLTGQES